MKFKPCIDLHHGKVKQIIGSTLNSKEIKVNFTSNQNSSYFAQLYRKYQLSGAHIIMLGPNNEEACLQALKTWPGHLQVGGGITLANGEKWLKAGAQKLIFTSYLFPDKTLDLSRLQSLKKNYGRNKIVIDLSCSKTLADKGYYVFKNKWKEQTTFKLELASLQSIIPYTEEILIHAISVEGKNQGMDQDLVYQLKKLHEQTNLNLVYAGGIHHQEELDEFVKISESKIDFTIGSALDIFGGRGFSFQQLAQKYSS